MGRVIIEKWLFLGLVVIKSRVGLYLSDRAVKFRRKFLDERNMKWKEKGLYQSYWL